MNTYNEITKKQWAEEAQPLELRNWVYAEADGDDWNNWWCEKLNNFQDVSNRKFESVLEVGCGPWAKNIQLLIKALGYTPKMFVNDPLLKDYIDLNKSVGRFMREKKVLGFTKPLEELECEPVDCIIMINVLDHVYSVKRCFEKIESLLRPGGVFILGQDLKDDLDKNNDVVKNDKMHPIMLDEKEIDSFISNKYKTIFKKVLSRAESRYPQYNSGAYLFIGEK